jgi:hypothetical protein
MTDCVCQSRQQVLHPHPLHNVSGLVKEPAAAAEGTGLFNYNNDFFTVVVVVFCES